MGISSKKEKHRRNRTGKDMDVIEVGGNFQAVNSEKRISTNNIQVESSSQFDQTPTSNNKEKNVTSLLKSGSEFSKSCRESAFKMDWDIDKESSYVDYNVTKFKKGYSLDEINNKSDGNDMKKWSAETGEANGGDIHKDDNIFM